MKVIAEVKFLGVERRAGFKDPSKFFNVAAFAEGLDVLRVYVDDVFYGQLCSIQPYSDVSAVFNLQPGSDGVRVSILSIAPADVKDTRQRA